MGRLGLPVWPCLFKCYKILLKSSHFYHFSYVGILLHTSKIVSFQKTNYLGIPLLSFFWKILILLNFELFELQNFATLKILRKCRNWNFSTPISEKGANMLKMVEVASQHYFLKNKKNWDICVIINSASFLFIFTIRFPENLNDLRKCFILNVCIYFIELLIFVIFRETFSHKLSFSTCGRCVYL